MMAGYSKLFSSIVTSSVWSESHATRLVWITMLALSDANGHVDGSIPGLAHQARVSIGEVELALEVLSGPDRYSRTPDNDGRRIVPVDGGWLILNYRIYREKKQAKDGSRAEYMRSYRSEHQNVTRNTEMLRDTASASAYASAFPVADTLDGTTADWAGDDEPE